MTSQRVNAYTVYPTGYDEATFIDKYLWAIQVENTGKGTWAVRRSVKRCLNRDGEWEYESIPSERTEEFFARCRFTEEDALRRASAVVDSIRINGLTIAEADIEVAARLAEFDRRARS